MLKYNVQHDISNPIIDGCHIHGPSGFKRWVWPCRSGMAIVGSIKLAATEVTALFSGAYYLNLHTVAYPSGDVTGILVDAGNASSMRTHYGILQGGREAVPVTTKANGIGLFTISATTLSYDIQHNAAVNGNGTHLHLVGGSKILLNDTGIGVANVTFNSSDYVNIHTARHSSGELRASLLSFSPVTSASLALSYTTTGFSNPTPTPTPTPVRSPTPVASTGVCSPSPSACNSHGSCSQGTCICSAGWTGQTCALAVVSSTPVASSPSPKPVSTSIIIGVVIGLILLIALIAFIIYAKKTNLLGGSSSKHKELPSVAMNAYPSPDVEEQIYHPPASTKRTAVPFPWEECKDDSGAIFYFNTKTQESVWEKPF